jgi:hypothetical protein
VSVQFTTAVRHNSSLQQFTTAVHYSSSLQQFTTAVHYNSSLQQFATTVHYNSSLQQFTTAVHYNSSLQQFTTTVHHNTVYKGRLSATLSHFADLGLIQMLSFLLCLVLQSLFFPFFLNRNSVCVPPPPYAPQPDK